MTDDITDFERVRWSQTLGFVPSARECWSLSATLNETNSEMKLTGGKSQRNGQTPPLCSVTIVSVDIGGDSRRLVTSDAQPGHHFNRKGPPGSDEMPIVVEKAGKVLYHRKFDED